MAREVNPQDLPESFPEEVREAYRFLWERHEAEFDPSEDWKVAWEKESAAFAVIQAHSKSLGEDEYVGTLMGYSVADGRAWYLVTATKPFTVAYIPVVDNYRIPDAHLRGLRLDDAKSAKRFQSIFG